MLVDYQTFRRKASNYRTIPIHAEADIITDVCERLEPLSLQLVSLMTGHLVTLSDESLQKGSQVVSV